MSIDQSSDVCAQIADDSCVALAIMYHMTIIYTIVSVFIVCAVLSYMCVCIIRNV